MQNVELSPALAATWEIVARANHYLVEKEPWKIKDVSRRDELASILYASAETLRILAVLTYPIMPRAATVLWSQLGIEEEIEEQRLPEAAEWGRLVSGTVTTKGESLFPRLETE
jgi:methionyl-tRNA synthetase